MPQSNAHEVISSLVKEKKMINKGKFLMYNPSFLRLWKTQQDYVTVIISEIELCYQY